MDYRGVLVNGRYLQDERRVAFIVAKSYVSVFTQELILILVRHAGGTGQFSKMMGIVIRGVIPRFARFARP